MEELEPGIYKHFKGNYYYLYDIATHTETLEKVVVYKALYGECKLWVRPLTMWTEMVEHEGKMVQRFTFVGEKALEIPEIREIFEHASEK